MSKNGILEALRHEEQSLRSQLVAVQRAIEAIRRDCAAARWARQAEGRQGGRQAEACHDGGAAQGGRRADAEVLGLAAGHQGRGRQDGGMTR